MLRYQQLYTEGCKHVCSKLQIGPPAQSQPREQKTSTEEGPPADRLELAAKDDLAADVLVLERG